MKDKHISHHIVAGARYRQAGLSLVELLVALALGLMLTAGIIQLFVGSKQTYRFEEALSRLQENGRFAIETLNRDVRMAGNMGCMRNLQRENPPGTGNLMPGYFRVALNSEGAYEWDFGSGLQGYQWNGSGWTPALPTALSSIPVPNGNDVITLRGITEGGITVTSHPGGTPPGSAALGVPAGNGVEQFDIMLVTDCTSAAVFQVSSANPNTSGSLAHNTGVGTPGNVTRRWAAILLVRRWLVSLLVPTSSLRVRGAGAALFRRVNQSPAEELLEGVEGMRFAYGVDTNGDLIADPHTAGNAYWSGTQVNAANRWGSVVSVRISLLLQSIDNNVTDSPESIVFDGATVNSGGSADRRLRQVFVSTVGVRNRLP